MTNSSDESRIEGNSIDAVIDAYKKDIDRTLLRENLKLNVDERFRKFQSFLSFLTEVKKAGKAARKRKSE